MCDKICPNKTKLFFKKMRQQNLAKNQQNYIFGEKAKFVVLDENLQNYCKNCSFFQK